MGKIWDTYFSQKPMKYYQPLDYKNAKAQAMIENENGDYIAEQKFDGEWCRIIKDDDRIVAQSRNISVVTKEYGDKTELIPHIIAEFNNLPNGTVLLGELCFLDETKTSKDVGTILRCKPDKAVQRQKDCKLVFRTFDCLAWNGVDIAAQTYAIRFNILQAAVQWFEQYLIAPVAVFDNFSEFLQDILARGGEGIVIHSKMYTYTPGGRPAWKTLKVKKITAELELPIVDFIEPNKNYEGKDRELWNCWQNIYQNEVFLDHAPEDMTEWTPVTKPYFFKWKNGVVVSNNGKLVRVTSGLTDDDRRWLATDEAAKLLQGKQLVAVVSAMEVTEDGSLRHPRLIRIRTDA